MGDSQSAEQRREIEELAEMFRKLKAEKTGRRAYYVLDIADTDAWKGFMRLRNVLKYNEIWEERDLFLEAQFKYCGRDRLPVIKNLTGPAAFRKYYVHRKIKRAREMSLERAKDVKAKDIKGPYLDAFSWSAYNLKQQLCFGITKMECYKHLTDLFSEFFIASDVEAYVMLKENPDTFGEGVGKAFETLKGDPILKGALRELWRKEIKEQCRGLM